jgi:hypothetical protein
MESYESKNEEIDLKKKDKIKYNILLQDLNSNHHYIKLPLISPFPIRMKNKGNISLNSQNKSNYSIDLSSINSKQASNKRSINYSNNFDDFYNLKTTKLFNNEIAHQIINGNIGPLFDNDIFIIKFYSSEYYRPLNKYMLNTL